MSPPPPPSAAPPSAAPPSAAPPSAAPPSPSPPSSSRNELLFSILFVAPFGSKILFPSFSNAYKLKIKSQNGREIFNKKK